MPCSLLNIYLQIGVVCSQILLVAFSQGRSLCIIASGLNLKYKKCLIIHNYAWAQIKEPGRFIHNWVGETGLIPDSTSHTTVRTVLVYGGSLLYTN